MSKELKHQWRITKYNPAFRDENGNYTKIEEWTSPFEIGKTFNGKEFTFEDYCRVENAYINTILKFLNESKVSSLRILQLDKHNLSLQDKSSLLYENNFNHVVLEEDMIVNKQKYLLITLVNSFLFFCFC